MKQLTTIIFAATLAIGLSSCGQSKKSKKNDSKYTVSGSTQLDSISYQGTPESLVDIVNKIAAINEVQSAHVGVAGVESDNYRNFLELKKIAKTSDLLQLTDNKNPVVACYAALALANKSYPDLKSIFLKFLTHDRQVSTFSGCIKSGGDISSELYHAYWNNIDDKKKPNDAILIQLDSIILFNKNSYWLLTTRAIENRVYQEPYKRQIEKLAFEQANHDAIYYFCTWHRAEYQEKIKIALLKHLENTHFENTGTTDYYKTLEELFKFKDPEIEKIIVAKMKKDRHWEMEKERFKYLLEDNYIYDIDSE